MVEITELRSKEEINRWNVRTLRLVENVPYYVYKHYLDGQLFYIGKGQKSRCLEFDSRGPAWKNFVDGRENEVLVDISKTFSNENEAYNFESNEILLCESEFLVNVNHNKGKVIEKDVVTRPLMKNRLSKKIDEASLFKKPTYVIYGSALHDLDLHELSSAEIKLFISLMSLLDESSLKGENLVMTVPFTSMRTILDNKGVDSSQLKKRLNKCESLNLLNYKMVSKLIVEITFSKDVTEKVLSNEKGYTVLNLNEFVSLISYYSSIMYMKLSENRMKGELVISKENLLILLSPPKSYIEYDTIRRLVIQPLKENLQYFPNLMFSNLVSNVLPEVCKFNFFKKRTTKMERVLANANKENILEIIEKCKL